MLNMIMKFKPEYIPLILQGRKTSTVRNERKGDFGDSFVVEGHTYVISSVLRVPLTGALEYFYGEGFDSRQEMYDTILAIYPNMTLDTYVYLHRFETLEAFESD